MWILKAIGKDVGTVESLWRLIWNIPIQKMLWIAVTVAGKIYSRNLISRQTSSVKMPKVEDSLVDGCFVDGTVKHSILSAGAQVRKGCRY